MNDYQTNLKKLIEWRNNIDKMQRLDIDSLQEILDNFDEILEGKTQIPSPEEIKEYIRNKKS